MNITKLKPPTPGEILLEEFLQPFQLSQSQLARLIQVPRRQISEIIHGRRSITPEMAARLSKFFGTSVDLWLNLQYKVDIWEARARASQPQRYEEIQPMPFSKVFG